MAQALASAARISPSAVRPLLLEAADICGASKTFESVRIALLEDWREVGVTPALPRAPSSSTYELFESLGRIRVALARNHFSEAETLCSRMSRGGSANALGKTSQEMCREATDLVEMYELDRTPAVASAMTDGRPDRQVTLGRHDALLALWALAKKREPGGRPTAFMLRANRRGTQDLAVHQLLWPDYATPPPLGQLCKLFRSETSWLRRLILAMVLAEGFWRQRKPDEAARMLAAARGAYAGYLKWLASRGRSERPQLLRDYEEACERGLAAFEPPVAVRRDAVATLVRVARRLRRRRRPRPSRAISALDAVITIGRSTTAGALDRRVAHEIAAMLDARVLLHRQGREWLTILTQAEHTLSTWTVLRLARLRRLRAFRVRPRPEYWRPDQRRPGAILAIPVGSGIVSIARRRRFRRREIQAARTVLRFLEARLAPTQPASSAATPELAPPPIRSAVGEGLIGVSAAWRDVLRQVGRVAESTASVLLWGETGTGKERVARALHAASLRSTREFVAVNCGAIPASLLASELFGHIRGAFTGADRSRDGLFVRAHRGTLFLDEVGDMPPEMQVALLRVLEEREVRPVGSTRAIPVDVRIVSASAKDLDAEVAAGRFREDLYHRLNVVRIDLPPLRRRREDLPLLAAHLAARTPERATIHPDVLPLLLEHDWPGNVRELDNVLRASAVLAEGGEITPEVVRGVMAQRRTLRRLRREAVSGPRAGAILEALGSGWLSGPEIAARIGVSARTVNRDMEDLLQRGVVISSGFARARRYARARTTPPSSP
jgi:DNA-binding NtrC family response regulator